MRNDASSYVSKCLICEMYRASKPPKQGKMHVYQPCRRFEIVAVDILEISPKWSNGNVKVVVIGDTFTRFAWSHPVKDEKCNKSMAD